MVSSSAPTVKEYLDELPDDRRKALSAVRKVIRKNLPKGIVENMSWGMITYEVPLKTFPNTYNGKPLMYAAVASQKNHMAVYLPTVYADEGDKEWFANEYRKTGKKLDMGKSCVRFKTIDQLPVELIGQVIGGTTLEEFLSVHQSVKS